MGAFTTAISATLMGAALAMPVWAEVANPLTQSDSWQELKYDIMGDTPILDGTALFDVNAPERAPDAATVPITIHQIDPSKTITKIKVVIDENPSPLAAVFTFGRAMTPLDLDIRVRVNQYSNIRVLALTEQTDHASFINGRFVKASGGCSAPATKDPAQALKMMGEIRVKNFRSNAQLSTLRRDAQIMIRHPNYSGLQRNQITQLFVPAHFIDWLEVRQGDELLFAMEGGISISENPVFRFRYTDNGAPDFVIRATDTEGNMFEQRLSKDDTG